MKHLVKNKIPDLTPYVSLNYNGNISYGQISGSGLPSTIHAEEDGLYIEKNNKIWPMSHPDLSTLPSILPQRFGKLPIYEELIAVTDTINNSILYRKKDYYNSQTFFNTVIKEISDNLGIDHMNYNNYIDYELSNLYFYKDNQGFYLQISLSNYYIDFSNTIICTRKNNLWNIFSKDNYQEISSLVDAAYLVFVGMSSSAMSFTVFNKLIKINENIKSNIKSNIEHSTIFSDNPELTTINEDIYPGRILSENPYEDNLYVEDIYKIIDDEQPCIKINLPINITNIIQASAFNETNYSPVTIKNGIVTTELNFKPDYLLVQYFGEMENYYYINSNNSNSSKSLIGNFLMKDLTLKDINDVSDMSLVLGIYIGDNVVTEERLFVTAESLLNTETYKFRVSASTLPGNFQSSDFYTSTTKVVGQENKIFAGRVPFATEGNINGVIVDWGGESNTEAWLYLINKYNLDLSDYPTLEYASTHNGYLMGAGEAILFVTNHNAIWNAYTKLTGNYNSVLSWLSSFYRLDTGGNSNLSQLYFSSHEGYLGNYVRLDNTYHVWLLITLSKKYTLYFSWITYKWCEGSNSTMTKYCTNSSYGYEGFTDDKTELDLEDDAAYVNWGPAWRIPSSDLFLEIVNGSHTTILRTTQNGVNGCKITSKTNGNSIFLPAAGSRFNLSLNAGSNGYYWSRMTYSEYPYSARNFSFDTSSFNMFNYRSRCNGQSVRPVCTDSSQADHEYVDLGLPSGTLWATTNIGASTPEEYGLYFAWGETEGYQ